jgi:hypothetical protein
VKRSQKIQSEFKVSDKVYWWIRLRALVSRRDWRELEDLSKTRKSPIGWEVSFHIVFFRFLPTLTMSPAVHQ